MKQIISILGVLLLWQTGFCQNSRSLTIRKLQYDTTFYTQDFLDTTKSTAQVIISPLTSSLLTYGAWQKNVLFTSDSLFVFTKIISKRQKKLAVKKPYRFWKRINRKVKKGKISFYTTWYSFNQRDTRYNVKTTTKTFCKITERESKKVVFDKKTIIDSTEDSTTNTVSDYTYLSGCDTVFLNRKVFNINAICRNQGDYSACLFRTLIGNLKGHYNHKNPMGYFKTSSKVYKNSYEMYFNFENYLISKVTIAENSEVKYYCDFEIEKDSVHILNCATTEFSKGRIARRNNKIKFRHLSKNYSFYLRTSENYLIEDRVSLFGNRQTGHYALKLAQ